MSTEQQHPHCNVPHLPLHSSHHTRFASALRTSAPPCLRPFDTMASTSQPSAEGLNVPVGVPTERPNPVRHLSALEVDDESPSPSPVKPTTQRSALGIGLHSGVPSNKGGSRFSSYRPSMSSLRSGRIVSRRVSRAVEDGDEDAPKLPSLVPGIRAAYSTPLPMLPMVVLCIVSPEDDRKGLPAADDRLCCLSFCPRIYRSLSCLRWWKVRSADR